MPTTGYFFLVLLLIRLLSASFSYAKTNNLFVWGGDYLDPKEGAIYFTLDLSDPVISANIGDKFEIRLLDVLKKKSHRVQDDPGAYEKDSDPVIWKIPAGKYIIAALALNLRNGKKLIWKAGKKTKQFIIIKKISISNGGLWTLKLNAKKKLELSFSMIPNRYKFSGDKEDATVAAVFDGFSDRVQSVVGGKNVVRKAKNNYEEAGELLVRTRTVRNISMKWSIDLLKDRSKAKDINDVILAQDPYLRKCYTDRLEVSDGLRGNIVYGIVVNKSSGTFKKVRNIGGSISDHKLVNCIQDVLLQMQFSVSKNMLGKLVFEFDAFY